MSLKGKGRKPRSSLPPLSQASSLLATLTPEELAQIKPALDKYRQSQQASNQQTPTSNPPGYTAWLKQVSPELNWDYPHLIHIRKQLARVTKGQCRRLILNIPPQYGKTEGVTVRYPLWRLCRNPRLRVAITSYGQTQAEKYSRKSRRLAEQIGLKFGGINRADEWEIEGGGSFLARGVGSGITGNAVDLLIIDDPYKDMQDARSAAYRDRVWEWWTDALRTRLSKDSDVIVIHTRWRTDDMTGRLLADGGAWENVSIPALAEEGDAIGRAEGEPLCPELHPLEQLLEAQQSNSRSFSAIYQQRPIDLTGDFFKGLETCPIGEPPALTEFTGLCRFWDLASTEAQAGSDPDWTVGALMGRRNDGRFWVLDVVRDRLGPQGVRNLIRQTAERDGTGVVVRLEREGGASGKIAADAIITDELAGYPARAIKPTVGKAERAEPLAAQVEAGNVSIARAGWNAAFLAELRSFPDGDHDDQVDAASGAFSEVALRKPSPILFAGYDGRIVS